MMGFKTISVLAVIVTLAYGSQPGSHFQPPFGGNSGYSGNSGYNGNSGNNGNPGFSGNNGYSGNNGNSGNLGYSGNYNSGPQIPILRYENVNNGDGNYRYNYETGNGISAHESGSPRAPGPEGLAVTAEGGFSYRAPDGQQISISYTADENGFHPTGSHIPTPPPIPEAILRSIEFNRQNPSSDNGQYNARSYNQQSGGNQGGYHY